MMKITLLGFELIFKRPGRGLGLYTRWSQP